MNTKRKYRPPADAKVPEYLHEFGIRSGSKIYPVTKGTLVSLIRKPGLYAGQYEVLYAECPNGTLMITVEGPVSRTVDKRYRKVIREADVKQVHVKTRRK